MFTTLDTYSHVTDNMRYDAADKIDTTIGRNKGKESSSKKKPESVESTEKFEAYKGKKRKPGTGYVKHISANCWQGRYTPTAPCAFFASFLVRIVRFCKPNCTNNHIVSVCYVCSVSRNGQFMWSILPKTASCFWGSPNK